MKRLVTFLLAACMVCSMGLIQAQDGSDTIGTVYEKPAFRLMSVGVMEGYEDGTFRPEGEVTRAEMAAVAVRLLGISGTTATGQVFDDVAVDHWAAGDIEVAASMGLVQGTGNGLFSPEEAVVYEDAVKIMVELLGYGPAALAQGGYPMGYFSQAATIGLLRGVDGTMGEAATRGTIVLLADRALDIELLERQVGTGTEYRNNGETLYERLTSKEEVQRVRGIVTATEVTALNGYAATSDGMVSIDGTPYLAGNSNAAELLGYFVEAYVRSEDGDRPEILSIRSYANRNETVQIDAKELRSATKEEILTEKREDGQERFPIAPDATYLYNGKQVPSEEVDDDLLMIYHGTLDLISRDGTGLYDVVSIREQESFIIDRIVEVNTAVYFETGNVFRGKEGYRFLLDDMEITTQLLNSQGETVQFGDIAVGDVISLEVSLDETLCKAVISQETVEGTVTELGENGEIRIDDTIYQLYQKSDGTYGFDPQLKDRTTFLLDAQGNIVGNDGTRETAYSYGYVAQAGAAGGMGGFQIKVASYGTRQKRVEQQDNVETIYYTFQNGELAVLDIADSVLFNGSRISASQLSAQNLQGNAIRYRLDSSGEIREMDCYQLPDQGNDYNFNAELLSFGGYTAYEGFLADDSTKIILAPIMPDDDEDYTVDVEVTDKDSIKAYPIEVDPDTQIAESVIIWANMDAKTPKPIRDTVDVSIVGKVIRGTTEDGLSTCKVQMLTGQEEVYATSQDGDVSFPVVAGLKKGDLIRYNESSNGRIDNIQVLASITSLGDDYYRAYENSPNEEIFGIVKSIRLNRLSNIRNEMVDEITISLDEAGNDQGIDYHIARKDGPQVYLYDRKEGNIYASTTDEILGADAAEAGASKVFMFVKNNDPSVVVIIRD